MRRRRSRSRRRRVLGTGWKRIWSPLDVERRRAGRRSGLVALEREIRIFRRRHDRNIWHRLWPELDNSRFELGVDAPEQRTDVQIEQRAVSIHDAAGLCPRRQRIERTLLERLHHVDMRAESRCEVCLGQGACSSQVPKQLRHLSVIAGWHLFYPVNMQAPLGGVRLWAYRHLARLGRHRKAGPISRLSPLTQAQRRGVCKSRRDYHIEMWRGHLSSG